MRWWVRLFLRILKLGPVPRHISFIMDGNRRYAKRSRLLTIEGHRKGFWRLNDVCDFCCTLGIQYVTVYAFSLENFKRPSEEVDSIMDLIEEQLADSSEWMDMIEKNQVQVRVAGDLSCARPQLYEHFKGIVDRTRGNNRMILTIAFCYSAKHDIVQAARSTVFPPDEVPAATGVDQSHSTCAVEIPKTKFSSNLLTREIPPPDILIRTSGESRLSDYLAWQVSEYTTFHFLPMLWPEISELDLIWCILHQQLFVNR